MPLLSAEFIENFHFLRPVFLYGLIPALLLVGLVLFIQNSRSTWAGPLTLPCCLFCWKRIPRPVPPTPSSDFC